MKKAIIVFMAASIAAAALAWFVNSAPAGTPDTTFSVGYGESTRMIAQNLRNSKLIRSSNFFVAASYALRKRYVRAGRYRIHGGTGTIGILNKLTRGDVMSRKITIPEGFNLYQIAGRLEAGSICDAGTFTGYASDTGFLKQIGIDALSAEGYLFPDTYVFPEDSDPRDVIAVMYRRMKSVIGERPAYGPGMSLHEILTMASLVEKEARVYTEREFISSVFHNRLRKGMKLDCDPTVRYAVKKFTGPITLSDLKSDSPYNTYRRRGLPPTPICSPGRDSILAAMYPKKTDFLYFVARNDGSHQFSKTLKEHNEAVQKYQR
ncbi:MAG TPA: endolytic transglycosylase MltG [Spirochaetota bacterium]|nr:endolytic transglycosylase MltG [Spirochaetota bacterium]HOD16845.1 endolytic transglycosylase MltG [Spirochaetota bacterium]HPG50284.1 endolytic transglycosylase MltG [Spirochaetota bacterium]HPN12465.1 endolytic transglycosylase MltG [Spirochaetota bacterium]